MTSFYGENIYLDQNNLNYYNIITPVPSNYYNITDLNSYNNQNYNIISNEYLTNIYPYITDEKNIYQKTQQIPYEYISNIPYQSNTAKYQKTTTPYPKQYQTLSANSYKLYPKIQIYNNKTNTNIQPTNIQSPNTVTVINPISRVNTMTQKPSRNLYSNFDGRSVSAEKNNALTGYNGYNNLIQIGNNYNKNLVQNINLIRGDIVNENPQNIQQNNSNQTQINKQINETAIVTKIENNQNLMNNTISKNIYDNNWGNSNYNQLGNTQIINEEIIFDNNQLINNMKFYNNRPNITKSVHIPNTSQKIYNDLFTNENIENNNNIIIVQGEKEISNDQLYNQYSNNANNENIHYTNKILTFENQPFDNKKYYINNIYPSTNISLDTNKIPTPQKEKLETRKVPNPHSPFIENNGEIISKSNCKHYFRQTSTAPVTSYGYCQNQGRRNYMEDEGKVIENLNGDVNKILFCLFDGHGGGQVSKYLQEHFGNYMKKILNCDDYVNGFYNLFKIIDEDIKALNCPTVGSTATIVYIEKNDNKKFLYCANIGDSRCILINKNKIVRLSYDHRVADQKEKHRILSEGGIIVNNRVYGVLMLSRSFGDFSTKNFGVIVKPHVVKYELTEDDLYCVIASDGVWDVVKDIDCFVLPKMEKMGIDTGELSKRIVNEALKRKSKDNLSCFVIRLN